jgi:hypothetical protein
LSLPTLADDGYVHAEFTPALWTSISAALTDEGKNTWTKDDIYNYLRHRGFEAPLANAESLWFISMSHGFIVDREGDTVYMILK